jgi:hypothetical protein
MRENHAYLRDAGHPGSSIPQPNPNSAARRKSRRKSTWISWPAQKVGFESGLWYQGMSRVCPGCPQTTPRKVGEGNCIQDAYGERRQTSNFQHRMARPSHPKPHQSLGKGKVPVPPTRPQPPGLVGAGACWQGSRAIIIVLIGPEGGSTRSGVDSTSKPAIIVTVTGPDNDKHLLANPAAAWL